MLNENEILIFENNKVCDIFIKANLFVVKQYLSNILGNENKFYTLEQHWLKQFGAKLIKDEDNRYYKIKFNSKKHLTLFQIQFS